MGRIAKFENYRFLGNRKNMRVYDCDNQDEFAQIENLINDKDLILPGYIDPNRLHILYFKKSIETEIGKSPWMVMPSFQ